MPGLVSIRARMTAGFVLALSPLLLIACAAFVLLTARQSQIAIRRIVEETARRAALQLTQSDWKEQLDDLAQEREIRDQHLVLLVIDRSGTLLWKSGEVPQFGDGDRRPFARLPATIATPGAPARRIRRRLAQIWPAWERGDWIIAAARNQGAAAIAARRRPGIISWRHPLLYELSGFGSLTILVAALGAWLLVGHTLSPIAALAQQARSASTEDLRLRLKAPSQDAEIVELVDTLNGLLGRIGEASASRGRFYAAASHELRTPLTALAGHLELALTRERTALEYREALQEGHAQARRLTTLVQDLLLLNQLESQPLSSQEPVDLCEACEGAVRQVAPLAASRRLTIETEIEDVGEIETAPNHPRMLIRNLVENACKYASPGGRVEVRLRDGPPRLEVFNETTFPEAWDPEKLFEPFYRPDSSRSSRTGGNGLGLAICRAIARANGWTVTLEDAPGGVLAVARFRTPIVERNGLS